ncbi:hypothetical protein RHMOL_Rhmol01G0238700 [Rhododendron molle]|uniref:Uncharacterized protein n=1 Tax=Rhododendron molle TaxID=49168 RepID=A0ACC0Q7W8_RHOML|nr:hypothetical protein RHMOL_Rhmol01G0238700 [Rhododendron molle]
MRPMQSLEAELWALHDGLQLALDRKITQIYVEMDALAAVQLIMDWRFLMRKLGVEKIDHIYREGNKCADALANMAYNPILDFRILDIAPTCINSQLRDDTYGVSYPKLLYVS